MFQHLQKLTADGGLWRIMEVQFIFQNLIQAVILFSERSLLISK